MSASQQPPKKKRRSLWGDGPSSGQSSPRAEVDAAAAAAAARKQKELDEQLELEAQMMFPAAFQQHTTSGKPETSNSHALATVPHGSKSGEWQCPRCRHVGSGARPACIKCGERKMCPFGMECLRETCWFQHPPGYDRTLAVQRNAASRIVTVDGGYSASTPLAITHKAHFADPNRGKIGGGITKPKLKPGPAVRSDMPVSDGRAHAAGRADDEHALGTSAVAAPASVEPAAGSLSDVPSSTQHTVSREKPVSVGTVVARQQRQQEKTSVETVTKVIPVLAHVVPRMIGKSGSHIKGMISRSGARIRIDKITLANGGIDETRQNVVIEGTQDRVSVAQVLVQEVLDSFEQAIEEIIEIPNKIIGRLIGKNGETIMRISKLSGAEINLDPEIPGAPSRPVRIIGQQKKIVEARKLMLEFIEKGGDLRRLPHLNPSADKLFKPTPVGPSPGQPIDSSNISGFLQAQLDEATAGSEQEETITVPSRHVGAVIGKGGEMINSMIQRSGCQIILQKDHDEVRGSGKREVYLSGTPARMNEAKRLINELIEQCESHRHGNQRVQKMTEKVLAREPGAIEEHIPCENDQVPRLIGKGGIIIRCIRRQAGVAATVTRGDQNSAVHAVGKPPNVETAKALVQAKIAEGKLRAARQWTPYMERLQMILMGEIIDPATAAEEQAAQSQAHVAQSHYALIEEKFDPATGRTYYYNPTTQTSSWQRPEAPRGASATAPAPNTFPGTRSGEDPEQIFNHLLAGEQYQRTADGLKITGAPDLHVVGRVG